jgi:hypothetical protein
MSGLRTQIKFPDDWPDDESCYLSQMEGSITRPASMGHMKMACNTCRETGMNVTLEDAGAEQLMRLVLLQFVGREDVGKMRGWHRCYRDET